jgi:hypothetical protein
MSQIRFSVFLLVAGLLVTMVLAQDSTRVVPKYGHRFIDRDGDGYNDNAPDHDGDGIPNGLDPDWQGGRGRKGRGQRCRYLDWEILRLNKGQQSFSPDSTRKGGAVSDTLAAPVPQKRK